MPYSNLYRPLIESETIVPPLRLKPRNIYRLKVYEYADGKQKALTGSKTTLVFLIGIFEKKLHCLKISEVRPDIFFKWLSTIMKRSVTDETILDYSELDELVQKSTKSGQPLYTSKIKDKSIYKRKEHIYRVYLMSGVKQIVEVKFKPNVLLEKLG